MKNLLNIVIVMLISLQIHAQVKTISGTISDENGLPLPGVNIIIDGTTNGKQTNFDGLYSITAKVGDILSYSFLGYVTEERKVTKKASTFSFSMQVDSEALEEVVITAFGIEREHSELGYRVSSESIKIRGTSSLSGKVKGVRISKNEPQSGQLTAGEINDLDKWEDWLKALNKEEFQKIQTDWNFHLEDKIEVTINDGEGNPINNIKVSLFNESNEKIMTARTDITGQVTLFKDLNVICIDDYFLVQAYQDQNILGKRITKNHKKADFIFKTNSKISNDIDVMFTIDATGSMGDEINYLKSELKNIITRLDESIKNKRIALTFYRDEGDDYVVKGFDFNSNIDNVKEILSYQNASGGGDYEEAVEEALKVSMSKSWNINSKAKLLFLLLDAPPHLTQENVEILKSQIKIAQEKGIKIIPIVASGADKSVEFLMRFFSVSTNGTYVFLTDDSGIGNPHLKPTTDDFKVEKLNDLIVRLIEKYSGVTN